jgi:hypothetical protein
MKIQHGDIIREATENEIEAINAIKNDAIKEAEANKIKAAARQAVLDKLGLTADEVAALLG